MHEYEFWKRCADVLETEGHIKRNFSSPKGFCAVGVMRAVNSFNGMRLDEPTIQSINYEYKFSRHIGKSNIAHWNDSLFRRSSQVITAFRELQRKSYIEFLESEIVRLNNEIKKLTLQLTKQQNLNKRLIMKRPHRLTTQNLKTELQELDESLETTWKELHALQSQS